MLTLGGYAIYWHHKAYQELAESFYVRGAPRWLFVLMWVPIIGIVPYLMYMKAFLGDLNAVRAKLALEPGPDLATHGRWVILGALILFGPVVAYWRLQDALNEIWETVAEEREMTEPVSAPVMRR